MFFLLSEVPGRGHIKQCPGGCVHFTYGPMTLHFRDAETLTLVGDRWGETLEQSEPGDLIELCYGMARLTLTSDEAREVGRMLREAIPAADAGMAGTGEVEFTQEENGDEWPEGEVPVSLPADLFLPRHEQREKIEGIEGEAAG
jgi:hypothetical protein